MSDIHIRKGRCRRRVREACGPNCPALRRQKHRPVRRACSQAGRTCEMVHLQTASSAVGQRREDSRSRPGHKRRSRTAERSEEHTSELQSLMRNSYAVFCLKKTKQQSAKKQNTDNLKHK